MATDKKGKNCFVPALGLFLLAPLVGEFLLGNLPVTWIWTLIVLAPMYGGGALLIRETARRFRLGWPGIVLLGMTYALIEEAFVTQSLFNPEYLGFRLLDYGFIPALGISSWWTVFVLSIHTIWSTAVPIALTEALSGKSRDQLWLSKWGLGGVAVVFMLGCAASAFASQSEPFRAETGQFVVSAVAVVLLIACAAWIGRFYRRRAENPGLQRPAPSPMKTGVATFLLGSTFMALAIIHSSIPAWPNAVGMLAILALGAYILMRWGLSEEWTSQSEISAAVGFLMVYAWYGFVQIPSVGGVSWQVDAVGNALFATGAVILSFLAVRRTKTT